jgi:Short C-terminal domain
MSGGPAHPPRRGWALTLVVLASILAFAAILAIWANRQLLNTDNWTRTSTQLLENRVIRDQISAYLVDELYANVDVAGEIREALPERLQPLAGPAAGGLRDLAERAAREALARPRAQQRWADANRAAQLALLKILEGGGPVVQTGGGNVVLDLTALLEQMQERFGIGGRLAERLPASAAQITIMQSDRLDAAQTALKIVRGLPFVLVGLSLLLFGAALAIAPGWRRQALRAYGIGLVAAGAAALLTQAQAGEALVNALVRTAATEPAAANAWTISTTLLVQAAWATIFYGIFMFIAAWLAGPSRPTAAMRGAVAPYAGHPAIAYTVFAVFVALLLWWAPTPATRDPALALILIALLAAGAEALRRQMAREHPGADLGAAVRRARERAAGAAAWARRGTSRVVTEARTRAPGGSPNGDRLEQLERLGRLRQSGVIDEQEFAAQKRLILAGGPEAEDGTAPPPVPAPG